LDVAEKGLPDDLGEHQVADGVAIQQLRKRFALEADEAKQVENDEKGVAAADPWRPAGVGRGLALCHVDAPR
jgi:hypothetical protein